MKKYNNLCATIYNELKQHPDTLFINGKVNYKSYTIIDENLSIEVCDKSLMQHLINQIINFYEKQIEETTNLAVKKIKQLKDERIKEKKEHDEVLKTYNEAIEENRKYKEWYGTLISPVLVAREMWNNGNLGRFDTLIPHTRWKTGIGLKGKGGTTAILYWISIFEELELIKTYGKGKYLALVGLYEAIEVLTQFKSNKKGDKNK